MNDAEWPAPEPATPREPERRTTPLPRVEDLPIAEQGYDREKVREAFDAFYRHAARLDATLSTLEAVEVFQRTSAELRAELRNIRGSGWTVQSWQGGTGYAGGGGSRGRVGEWTLPPSFPRLALEFGFLIAIGVVVGVAGWSALTIVLVMGLALGVVLLLEWVAARERAIPRAAAPAAAPDLDREEPAELPVGEGWVGPEEGPEALTMLDDVVVEVPVAEAEPEPEPEAVEPDAVDPESDAVEVEAEVTEPEPAEPPVEEPDPEPEPVELQAEEPGEPPVAEAVLVVDEPEPMAEAVEEQRAEPTAELTESSAADRPRRFGVFGRRREAVAPVEPEPEPVPVESEELLDPWEQDAQLPPLEPQEFELEPEQQVDSEEQLVEPPRRSWFRRRPAEEEAGVEEPMSGAVGAASEPELEPEPEPELEPEPEPEPEDEGPLPVDLLAEQAAAALERSRARRRTARRTRRR